MTVSCVRKAERKGDESLVRKGEIIVAIDPELRDMYCCEVMSAAEENKERPLCKVLYMVAYPLQHDTHDSGIAQENPPLPNGAICRLQFTRRVETDDRNYRDYEATYDKCLGEYRDRRKFLYDSQKSVIPACRQIPLPSLEEFAILNRHARREFRTTRKFSM